MALSFSGFAIGQVPVNNHLITLTPQPPWFATDSLSAPAGARVIDYSLSIGDINGDGTPDIVLSHNLAFLGVWFCEVNANGEWVQKTTGQTYVELANAFGAPTSCSTGPGGYENANPYLPSWATSLPTYPAPDWFKLARLSSCAWNALDATLLCDLDLDGRDEIVSFEPAVGQWSLPTYALAVYRYDGSQIVRITQDPNPNPLGADPALWLRPLQPSNSKPITMGGVYPWAPQINPEHDVSNNLRGDARPYRLRLCNVRGRGFPQDIMVWSHDPGEHLYVYGFDTTSPTSAVLTKLTATINVPWGIQSEYSGYTLSASPGHDWVCADIDNDGADEIVGRLVIKLKPATSPSAYPYTAETLWDMWFNGVTDNHPDGAVAADILEKVIKPGASPGVTRIEPCPGVEIAVAPQITTGPWPHHAVWIYRAAAGHMPGTNQNPRQSPISVLPEIRNPYNDFLWGNDPVWLATQPLNSWAMPGAYNTANDSGWYRLAKYVNLISGGPPTGFGIPDTQGVVVAPIFAGGGPDIFASSKSGGGWVVSPVAATYSPGSGARQHSWSGTHFTVSATPELPVLTFGNTVRRWELSGGSYVLHTEANEGPDMQGAPIRFLCDPNTVQMMGFSLSVGETGTFLNRSTQVVVWQAVSQVPTPSYDTQPPYKWLPVFEDKITQSELNPSSGPPGSGRTFAFFGEAVPYDVQDDGRDELVYWERSSLLNCGSTGVRVVGDATDCSNVASGRIHQAYRTRSAYYRLYHEYDGTYWLTKRLPVGNDFDAVYGVRQDRLLGTQVDGALIALDLKAPTNLAVSIVSGRLHAQLQAVTLSPTSANPINGILIKTNPSYAGPAEVGVRKITVRYQGGGIQNDRDFYIDIKQTLDSSFDANTRVLQGGAFGFIRQNPGGANQTLELKAEVLDGNLDTIAVNAYLNAVYLTTLWPTSSGSQVFTATLPLGSTPLPIPAGDYMVTMVPVDNDGNGIEWPYATVVGGKGVFAPAYPTTNHGQSIADTPVIETVAVSPPWTAAEADIRPPEPATFTVSVIPSNLAGVTIANIEVRIYHPTRGASEYYSFSGAASGTGPYNLTCQVPHYEIGWGQYGVAVRISGTKAGNTYYSDWWPRLTIH